MIGLAKDGSLHARRQALGFVYDDELVKSLFEQVGAWLAGPACWLATLAGAEPCAAFWCPPSCFQLAALQAEPAAGRLGNNTLQGRASSLPTASIAAELDGSPCQAYLQQ